MIMSLLNLRLIFDTLEEQGPNVKVPPNIKGSAYQLLDVNEAGQEALNTITMIKNKSDR